MVTANASGILDVIFTTRVVPVSTGAVVRIIAATVLVLLDLIVMLVMIGLALMGLIAHVGLVGLVLVGCNFLVEF